MKRRLHKRLFLLIVLFLAGSCCVYLKNKIILQDQVIEISKDIKKNEIYPLYIEHSSASIYENADEVSHQAHKKDWKYLKELKEKLKGDDLSRGIKFEEDFLRAYLISTNYEIDIAFWKILNFLRLRENHEYFFRNVSFDFTQYEDYRFVSKLPHRLKDGSATVVFQLGKWNPDIVPLEILKQIIFMVHVQELRNPMTQASGFNIIYDFKDSGFRHLKYGTPYNLRLIHDVSFEALPARFLGFHMININSIGRILLALARPFLPQYVEKIFYTHSSLKELLNYYPVSMLPVEYGGNLTDYYPDDWIRNANKEHGNFPLGGLKNIF